MILHYMVLQSYPLLNIVGSSFFIPISYIPFSIAIFSALRLARFNIDTDQTDSFKGLPTPASAILIISLPLILQTDVLKISGYLFNTFVLVAITILLSVLLVSNTRLFALKFKNFRWTDNQPQYLLIAGSIILFFIIKVVAVPFIILLYLILSLLFKDKIQNS